MDNLSCVEESIFYPVEREVKSRPSYTLAEIEQLAGLYIARVAEPNSLVDWRMSDFIQWLKRREKEGGRWV